MRNIIKNLEDQISARDNEIKELKPKMHELKSSTKLINQRITILTNEVETARMHMDLNKRRMFMDISRGFTTEKGGLGSSVAHSP